MTGKIDKSVLQSVVESIYNTPKDIITEKLELAEHSVIANTINELGMKILYFYEDDDLSFTPKVLGATTYHQLEERLFKTKVLYTNETSALNFDYFSYYDVIQIHTHDNRALIFYKPDNKEGIISHNTTCQKELRISHNLRKLWIAGYFK